jgi:flagellar protein FlaG
MRGDITVPPQKEHLREKSQSQPVERKETPAQTDVQFDAYLPNTSKNQASDLKQTASELEHISLAFNRRLKFIVDQDSKELIVKVIDNETDKVIRVLPPEELQRLHSRIRETMGFLFDRLV